MSLFELNDKNFDKTVVRFGEGVSRKKCIVYSNKSGFYICRMNKKEKLSVCNFFNNLDKSIIKYFKFLNFKNVDDYCETICKSLLFETAQFISFYIENVVNEILFYIRNSTIENYINISKEFKLPITNFKLKKCDFGFQVDFDKLILDYPINYIPNEKPKRKRVKTKKRVKSKKRIKK